MALSGKDWPDLYRSASTSLLAVMGLKGGAASGARRERVALEADGPEDLLVVWLEELIYRLATRREVLCGFRFEESGPGRLVGTASWRGLGHGEAPRPEVKAATYQGLKVVRRAGAWSATVILDV